MGDNNTPDNDRAVKSTADDATLAKLSCVNMGYYQDTFIQGMSLVLLAWSIRVTSTTDPIIELELLPLVVVVVVAGI